ncbi:MAG: ABC transporter ATP-binding protein [Bacteroidetes bacterium]|nr:MAG: ABC transporter ATP-binding protein [Bacteroidota bacterium]
MSSDKDIAIRVENLSKMYRLGAIGTGTLSHDLNVYWHKLRGKGNPYARVGEENNRELLGDSDYVWALRDINFEVKKGEILGIIGKNGAGKSTLLKILSRITGPTDGSIKVNGRMASLLEVGTGFHPELTGRENIYLNGAIMGMTKREITSKLEEIVDFSGCARYIDTPVKRYSSGMTVRLGFAVAAFLEPEILIVDEVLAVGDAEFQKKAIGKMQEVSKGEGRTVLFVSHNMGAMKTLCTSGILMTNGKIQATGNITEIIEEYQNFNQIDSFNQEQRNIIGSSHFSSWELVPNRDSKNSNKVEIIFNYKAFVITKNIELGLVIRDSTGNIIYGCNSRDNGGDYINLNPGEHKFTFIFSFPVKGDLYELDIAIVSENKVIDQWVPSSKLLIKDTFNSVLAERWKGVLRSELQFTYSSNV